MLSIVIPVYNNWWLTRRCLRALEALRAKPGTMPFEVILVDNASTDQTSQEANGFDLIYLRQDRNLNFAGGCNAGAARASGESVLFLNNDAMPLDDPFPALCAAFDDPRVAVAGGLLLFEDGAVQSAGMVFLENAHTWLLHRSLPQSVMREHSPIDMPAVAGAAFAVRRSWMAEHGGFDEGYRNGFEDTDLCMRVRAAGDRVVFVPQARFMHLEGASEGRFDYQQQNERRFYERWSQQIASIPRMRRGEAKLVEVFAPSSLPTLSACALEDAMAAMRTTGAHVYRGSTPFYRRIEARYASRARLTWFSDASAEIAVQTGADGAAQMRLHGAIEGEAPWLPSVDPARVAQLRFRASPGRVDRVVTIDPENLFGEDTEFVDALIIGERPDPTGYGNALIALSRIPVLADASEIEEFYANMALAQQRAQEAQAMAQRLYSLRRGGLRLMDTISAVRFGPERPGQRTADSPIPL